jgi:metallo-beta-lactamase family protein
MARGRGRRARVAAREPGLIELFFHGAAGEVTGSMHLVGWRGQWIALDCGLFQGRRAESEAKNREWPLAPRQLAALIVSHAHTDHTGRIPKLAKDGFEGPVYCSPATRDLCAIMLPDSAHIQQEDVFYINKKRKRKGLPPVEALYSYEDVVGALGQFRTIALNRWFEVLPGLRARFLEAGHMLGSCGIELEFDVGGGRAARLFFSGDVGRRNTPILRDPAPFPQVDYVICESTYGGREHGPAVDAQRVFRDVVRAALERGGKVIIPAFSVGRTQTIVYFLHRAMAAGELPRVPVFVDSPLAVAATEVFRMHPDCFDVEASAFQQETGDILGNGCCVFIRDVEESKALHRRRKPCVIISASGMCESGRIQHHIKNNIGQERNLFVFPGFQAENTLGRKIVDGARKINLFHETRHVRAQIVQIDGFSGHADRTGLLRMLTPLAARAERVFLVHGETQQRAALAAELRGRGFAAVEEPLRGQRVTLVEG